jgi:hypothetical protein
LRRWTVKKMVGLMVPALVMVWAVAGFAQTILTGGGSTPGVVVQGAASQSANFQEWKNSAGTVVASVNSSGKFTGDASGLSGVESRSAISACGTISQPGSYYVTQNLSTTGTCILVTANDVTIDLNGFILTGDGLNGNGIEINSVSSVEVRNGTVGGFYIGIMANWNPAPTDSNRVINVRAIGNYYGIFLNSQSNLIKDCSVAYSSYPGGYGIFARLGSMLTNNTAFTNNQSNSLNMGGINVINSCIVKNNTLHGNLQNNIYVNGQHNDIEGNLVNLSTGNGIFFNGGGNFYVNNKAFNHLTDYNTNGNHNEYGPLDLNTGGNFGTVM